MSVSDKDGFEGASEQIGSVKGTNLSMKGHAVFFRRYAISFGAEFIAFTHVRVGRN